MNEAIIIEVICIKSTVTLNNPSALNSAYMIINIITYLEEGKNLFEPNRKHQDGQCSDLKYHHDHHDHHDYHHHQQQQHDHYQHQQHDHHHRHIHTSIFII